MKQRLPDIHHACVLGSPSSLKSIPDIELVGYLNEKKFAQCTVCSFNVFYCIKTEYFQIRKQLHVLCASHLAFPCPFKDRHIVYCSRKINTLKDINKPSFARSLSPKHILICDFQVVTLFLQVISDAESDTQSNCNFWK